MLTVSAKVGKQKVTLHWQGTLVFQQSEQKT